jgi:hypothetical protein
MQVDVDTHRRDGARLPQVAEGAASYETTVFDAVEPSADARIKAIIAANAGAAQRPAIPAAAVRPVMRDGGVAPLQSLRAANDRNP